MHSLGELVVRVLPAYAGMIPSDMKNLMHSLGAPRVCGDDPIAHRAVLEVARCSPRMRG